MKLLQIVNKSIWGQSLFCMVLPSIATSIVMLIALVVKQLAVYYVDLFALSAIISTLVAPASIAVAAISAFEWSHNVSFIWKTMRFILGVGIGFCTWIVLLYEL